MPKTQLGREEVLKTILGINPGISRVGYCVFKSVPLEYGTYFMSSEKSRINEITIDNLSQIVHQIESLINGYMVNAIAVKQAFVGKENKDRALSVQTMMRVIAMQKRLPYFEQHSKMLLRSFLGEDRGNKTHMKAKVESKWGITDPSYDANFAIMTADVASCIPTNREDFWWQWNDKFSGEK